MSKFVSFLDHIGSGLKHFFTSPVAANVITSGLGIAGLIDPPLIPLFSAIGAAVTRAETLAAAANAQSGSGPQKLALALSDAQSAFKAYEDARGVTIESAQQTAIINAVVAMFNNIPATPATTDTTQAAAVSAPAPAAVAPVAAAPAVVVQAVSGPGLHAVVAS